MYWNYIHTSELSCQAMVAAAKVFLRLVRPTAPKARMSNTKASRNASQNDVSTIRFNLGQLWSTIIPLYSNSFSTVLVELGISNCIPMSFPTVFHGCVGLGQLHHWSPQTLSCQAGVETIPVHRPGLEVQQEKCRCDDVPMWRGQICRYVAKIVVNMVDLR